jgi:prophage antirepressor-like protein
MNSEMTPFERIRRVNPAGNEFWSSRDFARVLGYTDYRNFEAVSNRGAPDQTNTRFGVTGIF